MKTSSSKLSGNRGLGMNWITQQKRLAIYLRDGLACAYCGDSAENGASLTLDHLVCRVNGGGNEATNLVTCCGRCNSSRGDRSIKKFSAGVAAYLNHGLTSADILRHIRTCTRRELPTAEAKALIARRGSAARVLASM